jgi:catechol 2,3-dioxygenase-like lactoylglutathione lyase family enzyme
MYIEHTALIVRDYDEAIRFFVDALGFELAEDAPATTNDGRANVAGRAIRTTLGSPKRDH